MRISDWSSDVCSSDHSTAPEFTAASPVVVTGVLVVPPCVLAPPLKSTEPVIVVGAVRLKLKLVLEAPVIALPPPVLPIVVGPLKLTLEPEPAMPWLIVVEPPNDMVLPTPVTDSLMVAPLLKVMFDPCCPIRSDAHTSELQSLMRNS